MSKRGPGIRPTLKNGTSQMNEEAWAGMHNYANKVTELKNKQATTSKKSGMGGWERKKLQ